MTALDKVVLLVWQVVIVNRYSSTDFLCFPFAGRKSAPETCCENFRIGARRHVDALPTVIFPWEDGEVVLTKLEE